MCGASLFRIKGSLPRKPNGRADEVAIKRKEKQIAKLIEMLEISED